MAGETGLDLEKTRDPGPEDRWQGGLSAGQGGDAEQLAGEAPPAPLAQRLRQTHHRCRVQERRTHRRERTGLRGHAGETVTSLKERMDLSMLTSHARNRSERHQGDAPETTHI